MVLVPGLGRICPGGVKKFEMRGTTEFDKTTGSGDEDQEMANVSQPAAEDGESLGESPWRNECLGQCSSCGGTGKLQSVEQRGRFNFRGLCLGWSRSLRRYLFVEFGVFSLSWFYFSLSHFWRGSN